MFTPPHILFVAAFFILLSRYLPGQVQTLSHTLSNAAISEKVPWIQEKKKSAQVLLFGYRHWPALVFLKWTGKIGGEDIKKNLQINSEHN